MRPGQNKRMRGRNNNNRKGPSPLTRSYESNGPDVKIRGTAHHIGEKYLQLARDAQSSGDPVMAESYLQHAEHYFRLIASAQQAQQQAQFGFNRPPGEPFEADDEGEDDDFVSLPDRFASPSERAPAPQQQPFGDRQSYGDRQPFGDRQQNGGERFNNGGQQGQHYGDRSGNERSGGERQSGYDRQGHERQGQERQAHERQGNDRQASERQGGDRQGYERQGNERGNYDRQDRGGYDNRRQNYNDRQGQDRFPQPNGNGGPERFGGERQQGDRPPYRGGEQDRGGGREERQGRDFDNRGFRNRNREDRPPREAREPTQQPEADEQPAAGLPAFITAPSRPAPEALVPSEPAPPVEAAAAPAEGEAGFHMRPRRRRRPKSELAEAAEGSAPRDTSEDGAAEE